MIKKIILGFSYLTWFICNIAIVYGMGYGAMKLIELQSVGMFILHLTLGMILLALLSILSVLTLGLIAMIFNHKEVEDKLDKIIKL